MMAQPVAVFASFEDRRLFLKQQMEAYRALAESVFNVLALPVQNELKTLENLPPLQEFPSFPAHDYSSTIKHVIEAREDVEKQLEHLETLSGPLAEAAGVFVIPGLKSQLRGLNEQLDNLNRMQAEAQQTSIADRPQESAS